MIYARNECSFTSFFKYLFSEIIITFHQFLQYAYFRKNSFTNCVCSCCEAVSIAGEWWRRCPLSSPPGDILSRGLSLSMLRLEIIAKFVERYVILEFCMRIFILFTELPKFLQSQIILMKNSHLIQGLDTGFSTPLARERRMIKGTTDCEVRLISALKDWVKFF